MSKKITIAMSPCPNDTFIFDALLHNKIDTKGLEFDYVLEDVATLNAWAMAGKYDISKVSYSAFLKLIGQYSLLRSGSALGRGVGPLLLTKAPLAEEQDLAKFLENARIAIPGETTTANLLLTLAFPNAKHKTEVLFSDIEQGLLDGDFDCGLVIHESRFTYAERGLHCLMDMGNWWEQTSGAAIPLGGIVVKNTMDKALAKTIEGLISDSIAYAWQQYPHLSTFITNNAQEMSESVMRNHIELYVNEYSADLGDVGLQAIKTLINLANQSDLVNVGATEHNWLLNS